MDWQLISTVAELLGVGMEATSFIEKFVNKGKESEALKLLCIMHTPTFAWKEIHLEYCTLRNSLEKIGTAIHNSKGKIKKEIDPAELQEIFQDKTLYRAVLDHKRKLSVSMNNIGMSFQGNDVIKKISSIGNEKIRVALEKIQSEKSSVERIHASICGFFDSVAPILDKLDWDDTDVATIIKARRIYKNDCSAIIDSTDVIVMKMLDIYEVAFEALKA